MNVVVELWSGEGSSMESDWMNFRVFWRRDQENGGECVVGGVGFKDDLCVQNPMS